MMIEWLAYALAVSLVVTVAAWLAEQGARAQRWPTRWIWAVALVVSVALPLAAWLAPAPAPTAPSVVAAPTTLVLQSIPDLPPREAAPSTLTPAAVGLLAWAGLSVLLLATVAVLAGRLAVRRRRWGRATVDGVEVWVSRNTGPAAMGLLRGHVVVPEWALELDAARRRLLVRHEAEHVRAGDPQLALGALVLCALVPWNLPLWWQLRRLRLAIEVDCDERVIRAAGDARGYGSLLLEVCQRRAHLGVALAESKSMLERRIRMIGNTTKSPATLRALGLSAVAGVVLAVACETPGPTGPADAGPEKVTVSEVQNELGAENCAPTYFINGSRSSVGVADALAPSEIEAVHIYRGEYMESIRVPEGAEAPCALVSILTRTATPDERAAVRRLDEEMASTRRAAAGESAPAVQSLDQIMEEPTFTPMTVRPQLRNAAAVRGLLDEYYPPLLRDAGIGGTANVWFLIDAEGAVRRAELNETSGYEALDAAALRVAEQMEFTPAYNRDQRVPVWVALNITFERRPGAADRPATSGDRPQSSAEPEVIPSTQEAGGPGAYTPMTQPPRLLNADEFRAAITNAYPDALRDQGVGGTVNVWVYINEEGVVRNVMVNESSGNPELDRAALGIIDVPRFDPAMNGDERVAVWVALDVRFEAQ